METNQEDQLKLRTPDLLHTTNSDWELVYEPAEDTFLLLDALENDLTFILSKEPHVCLEVGSGSGVIITALSHVFNSSAHCMAVDVNKHACKLTQKTAMHNNAFIDVLESDMLSCIKNSLIDMIVFNPPYVVTPSSEINTSDHLKRSWAGGRNGREIIDRFVAVVGKALSKNGFGYILLLLENDPEEVMKALAVENLRSKVVAKRKIRGERLVVVRFEKSRINIFNQE